jgi:hypothetical protein
MSTLPMISPSLRSSLLGSARNYGQNEQLAHGFTAMKDAGPLNSLLLETTVLPHHPKSLRPLGADSCQS